MSRSNLINLRYLDKISTHIGNSIYFAHFSLCLWIKKVWSRNNASKFISSVKFCEIRRHCCHIVWRARYLCVVLFLERNNEYIQDLFVYQIYLTQIWLIRVILIIIHLLFIHCHNSGSLCKWGWPITLLSRNVKNHKSDLQSYGSQN